MIEESINDLRSAVERTNGLLVEVLAALVARAATVPAVETPAVETPAVATVGPPPLDPAPAASVEPPSERALQDRCLALVRRDRRSKDDITRLLEAHGATKLKDLSPEQRCVFSAGLAAVEAMGSNGADATV